MEIRLPTSLPLVPVASLRGGLRRRHARAGVLACVVALAGFGGSDLARADGALLDPGAQRTVMLADGSIYSGQVVELVPGDHLTLKLPSGDVKRFAWSEMKPSGFGDVTVGGVGAATQVWPGGAAVFGMGADAQPPDPVDVHFRATDTQATLFRSATMMGLALGAGDIGMWTPVCHTPCDAQVDRHNVFSVQGPRLVSSPSFTLPQGGSLTVEANMGHESTRIVAGLVDALGITGMVAGVTVMLISPAIDTTATGNDPMSLDRQRSAQDEQHTLLVAGGAALGVGAAVLAVGIAMRYLSRTSVRIPDFGRIARIAPPGGTRLAGAPLTIRF